MWLVLIKKCSNTHGEALKVKNESAAIVTLCANSGGKPNSLTHSTRVTEVLAEKNMQC
jgi:hypothetical protein